MNKEFLTWLIIAGLLIGVTSTGVYTMTRGLRNNNPGNIRHGSSAWQGMSTNQSNDANFVQFDSPEYGIRALTKLLKNYQANHGLNTIREIINRWAPPSENITSAYVLHVARVVGINPDTAFNVNEKMVPLVSAIIKHENGIQPYDMETITRGISLAS